MEARRSTSQPIDYKNRIKKFLAEHAGVLVTYLNEISEIQKAGGESFSELEAAERLFFINTLLPEGSASLNKVNDVVNNSMLLENFEAKIKGWQPPFDLDNSTEIKKLHNTRKFFMYLYFKPIEESESYQHFLKNSTTEETRKKTNQKIAGAVLFRITAALIEQKSHQLIQNKNNGLSTNEDEAAFLLFLQKTEFLKAILNNSKDLIRKFENYNNLFKQQNGQTETHPQSTPKSMKKSRKNSIIKTKQRLRLSLPNPKKVKKVISAPALLSPKSDAKHTPRSNNTPPVVPRLNIPEPTEISDAILSPASSRRRSSSRSSESTNRFSRLRRRATVSTPRPNLFSPRREETRQEDPQPQAPRGRKKTK